MLVGRGREVRERQGRVGREVFGGHPPEEHGDEGRRDQSVPGFQHRYGLRCQFAAAGWRFQLHARKPSIDDPSRALAQVRERRNSCPVQTAEKSQNRMLILNSTQRFRLRWRRSGKRKAARERRLAAKRKDCPDSGKLARPTKRPGGWGADLSGRTMDRAVEATFIFRAAKGLPQRRHCGKIAVWLTKA